MALPALVLMAGLGVKLLVGFAITRILLALGLSYVVYQGMDALISNLRTDIESNYGGLWENIYAIVTLSGVDVAISVLFSAISIRLLLSGYVVGSLAALQLRNVASGE